MLDIGLEGLSEKIARASEKVLVLTMLDIGLEAS